MASGKVLEPGMDDAQAQSDRHGWKISPQMVTGNGPVEFFANGGGPEVGNAFDGDAMGEEYSNVTYGADSVKQPSGGAPSGLMEEKSSGGRSVATAPQNYTRTGGGK